MLGTHLGTSGHSWDALGTHLGTPGTHWEHWRNLGTHLGHLGTHLGALRTAGSAPGTHWGHTWTPLKSQGGHTCPPRCHTCPCFRSQCPHLGDVRGHSGVTHLDTPAQVSHLSPPVADHGVPTSVTFVATHPAQLVAGFRSGATVLYDLEVTKATLVSPNGGGSGQVNQVVTHPSQPLTITASDDRGIRYLDNRTGKVVHSMVAHLDAVTCLALDPSGAFLLSGSE
uniref:Uncharacterized protein n=1 Tax=Ficedula albicollis TaxID=59894 RepID=A0A803V6W6_FICAL